jgi:hypothetical protein
MSPGSVSELTYHVGLLDDVAEDPAPSSLVSDQCRQGREISLRAVLDVHCEVGMGKEVGIPVAGSRISRT